MNATRYPLEWPAGRPRTKFPTGSKFKPGSFAQVRDDLIRELERLGATNVIMSTNLKLRNDGWPLAGQAQPHDRGVAVYFTYKGRDVAFACDRWTKIEENILAITKTIEAIRGIARWGTGQMVDAAFSGFAQLPAATALAKWWEILGVPAHTPTDEVNATYRRLALEHHPDRNGGDDRRMKEINAAYDDFKRERGL